LKQLLHKKCNLKVQLIAEIVIKAQEMDQLLQKTLQAKQNGIAVL
jgi:hypothetical protein